MAVFSSCLMREFNYFINERNPYITVRVKSK